MTWQEAAELIDKWEQAIVIADSNPDKWVTECRIYLKILLKCALVSPTSLEKIMRDDLEGVKNVKI